MNNPDKDDSIWKQKSEVSNVWGASMPSTGSTWSNKSGGDEFSTLFQGIENNGLPKSENFSSWGSKGEGDSKMSGTNSFGLSSNTSSDLWFPPYDPFKKSWGEVDFASVTSSNSVDLKKVWDSQVHKNTESNIPATSIGGSTTSLNANQQFSGGNLDSEESGKNESANNIESTTSSSANHTIPKSSSTLFSPDNPQNDDIERSQPDGAEGFQQNKEEMIAKMVNSHDGWGKKPIRQDTPWQMEAQAVSQNQGLLPDANLLMPAGSIIGTDTPKLEMSNLISSPWNSTAVADNTFLGINNSNNGTNNSWGNATPSPYTNPSSNPAFFGAAMNVDCAQDNDISFWNGPPQQGCDMVNPNLWTGPPKDGAMWSSNNLLNPLANNNNPSMWPNDGDKSFWGSTGPSVGGGGDVGLGGLWQGASKMTVDKGLIPGGSNQFSVNSNSANLNQPFKSVGMWGDNNNNNANRQMEFGVWNQPRDQPNSHSQNALQILLDLGLKKEEAIQLLLSNNFNSDKLLEFINSANRSSSSSSGLEPPRGRMLRGKSVIETSTDYNQQFIGRGTSAFQAPQQQQPFFNNNNNNNIVSQQLQQQLLLQKVGLFGSSGVSGAGAGGIQHGRSSSMVPKLDTATFHNSNNKNQQLQQLQTLLQLQSVLQPLLVERAQLQQNTAIPTIQKKNRLEILNMDIFKVKALIDQLQLYGHTGAPTSSLSSSSLFNQSDPTGVEEARLLQALGQLKLDQISPTAAGTSHGINSWLPNVFPGDNYGHLPSKDGWNMFHGKTPSASFGGMFPPPPPGLNNSDKLGGGVTNSFMGQQGMFSRSTSWAPGEKMKTGPPASTSTCWLLIKNTSVMDGSALYSFCSQAGTLQQLLSNKLTGHSIACFRDEPTAVQAKLQQLATLSSECLANKDILSLLDASNSGGTASAWVAVTSSSSGSAAAAGGGSGGGGSNNSNNNVVNSNMNSSGGSSLAGSVVNE